MEYFCTYIDECEATQEPLYNTVHYCTVSDITVQIWTPKILYPNVTVAA